MRRIFCALALVCSTSGCYTVLRHPDVGSAPDEAAGAVVYEPGPWQDCAACHTAWDGYEARPRPACPPPWLAYSTGPWWQRHAEPHSQSQALANRRASPRFSVPPPPDVAVHASGPGIVIEAPAAGGRPRPGDATAPASGRGSRQAAAPHDRRAGAGDASSAPRSEPRAGAAATSPHPPGAPDRETAPRENATPAPPAAPVLQAAPNAPAAASQGSALANHRPRPA